MYFTITFTMDTQRLKQRRNSHSFIKPLSKWYFSVVKFSRNSVNSKLTWFGAWLVQFENFNSQS